MDPTRPKAVMRPHEDWTEKYRPKTLDGVVGNKAAVQDLRAWAQAWKKGKPEQRGILLAGPPGVGKTSACLALAQEMGWGLVELNASDQRNRDAVERVATRGALSGTFGSDGAYLDSSKGELKLILLDEADALHGRDETMGGLRAIVDALRRTEQPIALIANDLYALTKRSSALKDLCLVVKFRGVAGRELAQAVQRVLEAEGVEYEPDALLALAEQARGDLRAALRDAQALAEGTGKVGRGDTASLGSRDRVGDLWGLVGTVLRTRDAREARRAATEVDEEPRDVLTWVEDNMPLWYTDPGDRARAFDALSRADIFLGRTMRTQNYRLWGYATDLMTAGVALSKQRQVHGGRLGFPVWIRRMGASRHARGARASISKKFAAAAHTSQDEAADAFVPPLQALFQHAPEEGAKLAAAMGLEESEISFLMGPAHTKAQLRKVLDVVEQVQQASAPAAAGDDEETEVEEATEAAPETAAADAKKPAKEGAPKQRGLFDF